MRGIVKQRFSALALCLLLLGACGGTEPAAGDVALTLQLTQDRYAPDEAVEATIALTNVSEATIAVNGRLALNGTAAPPPLRDVVLTVTGPDGVIRPLTAQVNVAQPTVTDIVDLAPRASATRQVADLRRFYDLSAAGAYTVRATYASSFAPDGARVWQGEVLSNVVTIVIE